MLCNKAERVSGPPAFDLLLPLGASLRLAMGGGGGGGMAILTNYPRGSFEIDLNSLCVLPNIDHSENEKRRENH